MNERLRNIGKMLGFGREKKPTESEVYPPRKFMISHDESDKKIFGEIFYLDEKDQQLQALYRNLGEKPGMYMILSAIEGAVSEQDLLDHIHPSLLQYAAGLTLKSGEIYYASHESIGVSEDGKSVVARLTIKHQKRS